MADKQTSLAQLQVVVGRDALVQLLNKSVLLHFEPIVPTATKILRVLENAEQQIKQK